MTHAHLRNGLPFHSLQDQIFPPEAVKMRMMLVSVAQHGSGHKALFPPVGPGHCQQLHRFIFMWWEKISHRDFRLTLIRQMLAWSGHEPRPFLLVGRPAPASTNIGRLGTRHNKYWPGRNPTKRRCRLCSARALT